MHMEHRQQYAADIAASIKHQSDTQAEMTLWSEQTQLHR